MNRVACFQRTIDKIIRQHNLCGTYAYVNNIVFAGKTQQEHDQNLERFREIVELHKLILNQKKSIISIESIDFLGYTIMHGSLRPDADRLKPRKELFVPKDKTTLRHAVCLFLYYSQWIPKFSDKSWPLMKHSLSTRKQRKHSSTSRWKLERHFCIP